ncbi:MAG: hypothetical protein WCA60_00900, partial [Methanoregula sp.]
ENFLDYCNAIVAHPLSLNDPRLQKRPNESQGSKRRKAAEDKKPDLHDFIFEKHGIGGFSVRKRLPEQNPQIVL